MEQKPLPKIKPEVIEQRSDGEERFEKAIDIAIKTPAIRKESTKPSIVKRKP